MRRALMAGTLGPTVLVEDAQGEATLVAKVITTVADDERDVLAERLRERIVRQPAHAGLVPVVEVGIDAAGVYVVSPFVDAPALDSRLRGGRQPLVQVLEWLAPVAAGLHAAHERGGLHGAVHPRDVLLPRGLGMLTGVDISPALESLGLQAPVRVPLTAPERASGRPWDARADQYSLAMLALDALSGRRLIAGTIPAFDRWTLADTPGEDARLHEVFARALSPDPDERYPSVADWLEAVTGAAEPGTDLSRFTREGVIPPAQPAARRQPEADVADSALPLALFPAEDGALDEPPAARPAAAPAREEAPTLAAEPVQSPTGEWLVASMPDDAPPLADTGPMPMQASFGAEPPSDPDTTRPAAPPIRSGPPPAPFPGPPPAVPASAMPPADVDDLSFRSADTGDPVAAADAFEASRDASGATWATPAEPTDDLGWAPAAVEDDDAPTASRTGLVVAAALVLFALVAFGTWRSLTSDDATSERVAPVATAAPEHVDDPPDEGGPSAVEDAPLRTSAEDRQPGAAPPPETAPEAPPPAPVAASEGTVPPADAPREASASSPASPVREAQPAAPAQARAPAPTAAAGETPLSLDRARILIRSSPSGQVRINGTPRGQTPLVLRDLPFGSYVITVSRSGYVDAVREVDMLPSQPVASLTIDLERAGAASVTPPSGASAGAPAPATPAPAAPAGVGSLYVVSRPPDARLFIDGRAYGTAPAVIPGLAAGAHVVRLEYPGYRPWEGRAEVQPGQRVRIDATLVQEPR